MSLAVVAITINLFIILTLLQMAPKLHVLSQIVTMPMSTQEFLQTEPFSTAMGDKPLIDEMLVRYYLDMRLSSFSDVVEMAKRWGVGGPVWRLSHPSVYRGFLSGSLKEKLKAVRQQRVTQSVDVTSVSRLDNTFTIEYTLYAYAQGKISAEKRVAIIEVGYVEGAKYFRASHSNPYGMFIKSYNSSRKRE